MNSILSGNYACVLCGSYLDISSVVNDDTGKAAVTVGCRDCHLSWKGVKSVLRNGDDVIAQAVQYYNDDAIAFASRGAQCQRRM